MNGRSAAVQGGLAALGLIAAYATWQRGPELGADEVVILAAKPEQVTSVRFADDKKQVNVARSNEGRFDTLITSTVLPQKPPVPLPDGGVPPPQPVAPAPHPPRTLGGSELAVRLLEKFAPLKAVRGLGTLPPEKVKELGLVDSPRTLDVTAGGAVHHYVVSAGGSAPYLLDPNTQQIYLVQSALISDLDAASVRLIDRRLHAFKPNDVRQVVVTAAGKRRELAQSAKDNGALEKVTANGKPDEAAKGWLEKVWRIGGVDFLGKDELPQGGAPVEQFRVEYLEKGKSLGFLTLAKAGDETYVRSEHTVGWVRTRVQDELLKDATKIASGG